MDTIPIGTTSLRTSRLGYGCWRTARSGDVATDLATTRAAVSAALESGYSLFDHADIYCDGRAEIAFGQFLKEAPELRGKMLIATKCGIRLDAPYRYDFSAQYITQQCEQSLRRLGIERIDLYQLHRPDFLMDPVEVATAFDALHRAGKVREFGVSNFAPSQLALLQSALPRPLAVNQVEVSLCQLGVFADGTLDQCQAKRITPLAWSPLAGGLLADGATDILRHQKGYCADTLLLTLDEIAAAHDTSRLVIALAWLLRHPSHIVPLVGSAQPDRIREAVLATKVELTREEWYRLLTAAFGGPLP